MNNNIDMLLSQRVSELSTVLGYRFKDPQHLIVALTHSSFIPSAKVAWQPYERYEFLGDSVLDLVLSQELMNRHPEAREGLLSKWRAGLVNEIALSGIARRLRLQDFILVGENEAEMPDFFRPRLLASVFEALVAAFYLDGGLQTVQELIVPLMQNDLESVVKFQDVEMDHKSRLQEWAQKNLRKLPEYKLISSEGPEHRPNFRVEVWLDGEIFGVGEGLSKKAAEQEAARQAQSRLSELGGKLK